MRSWSWPAPRSARSSRWPRSAAIRMPSRTRSACRASTISRTISTARRRRSTSTTRRRCTSCPGSRTPTTWRCCAGGSSAWSAAAGAPSGREYAFRVARVLGAKGDSEPRRRLGSRLAPRLGELARHAADLPRRAGDRPRGDGPPYGGFRRGARARGPARARLPRSSERSCRLHTRGGTRAAACLALASRPVGRDGRLPPRQQRGLLPLVRERAHRLLREDRLARARARAGIGPILHSTQARYRSPVEFPDRVLAEAGVSELGADRFTMRYRVTSDRHGRIAAEGWGVVVAFDYGAGRKCALPSAVRESIQALEPALGRTDRSPSAEPTG